MSRCAVLARGPLGPFDAGMRRFCTLVLSLLAAACATSARIVGTADDRVQTLAQVADALVSADVVAMGEQHDSAAVHRTHYELLRQLHGRRPNLVIAMEMFERDVQNVLLQYVGGLIDEATFLEKTRPWPNYQSDYRPVVEFAKQNGLIILAANAPRPLAQKVSKLGIESIAGDPNVARETTAPEDEYWDAFQNSMGTHGGTLGEVAMHRFYAAQCLKDDTMAESIVDHLKARAQAGEQPLVVLIAGQFHTDHRRGTVARIQSRMPKLDIRVLSSEEVDDVNAGVYSSSRSVADYVVVVEKQPETPPPADLREALKTGEMSKEHAAQLEAVVAGAASAMSSAQAAEGNPAGLRPALGLMPDYSSQVEGVAVQTLREGGPAEKAGVEVGDVIVELAGKPVTSVETYTEVLDAQTIGKTVAVRVRRGDAQVVLQVLVASREPAR